ncbi:hypothetical protein J2T22_003921 [Pseudarthrobacter defluvii]|uniref:Uncharacterized protein n=1 Tax=Pseudarthrobacter defluvii TaxID=410837 RepID=A0ABT9UQZ2_9MICC|nr:hypothetical protein [Pseudarthrobacter defluvii]
MEMTSSGASGSRGGAAGGAAHETSGQGRRQPEATQGSLQAAPVREGNVQAGPAWEGRAPAGTAQADHVQSGSLPRRYPPDDLPPGDPGAADGPLKAMSPGVVDYLFRQLVSGRPAEDVAWEREGVSLAAQPEGAELARRLAETDLDALTPTELFHYVRAAQRLASWAEGLRQSAVGRYCHAGADAPRPGRRRI